MIATSEKGFTLIEVMVAMLVISFGMLAMGSLLLTTIKANQNSEYRMQAASTASSAMLMLEQKAVVDYYSTTAVSDVYTNFGITPAIIFAPDPVKIVAGGNTIILSFDWRDQFGTHTMKLQTRVAAD